MAKFLFCLPRFHTNAVPWMELLAAAGHEPAVDVMFTGPTENYELLQPAIQQPGRLSRLLRKIGLARNSELQGFPGIRAYWRHMQRVDPDVVIVRGITRWFCRMAAVYAVLQRRKLVIYDQEDPLPRRWTGTWFRRFLLRRLGVPHFTTRLEPFEGAQAVMNHGRAESLPFGCPFTDEQVRARGARPLAWPPRLLMVAKYRDRKGHADLLTALGQIAGEIPFNITFCGEEASTADVEFRESLERRAAELGIAERLSFRCNVPHGLMGEVYASHDLFILPSRNEPAAVSPIEAGWAGCAVLLSRDSGTRGYFPPGDGCDFEAGSPDDIARALRTVLRDRARLNEVRDLCRRRLKNVGDPGNILKKFESFLSQPALRSAPTP